MTPAARVPSQEQDADDVVEVIAEDDLAWAAAVEDLQAEEELLLRRLQQGYEDDWWGALSAAAAALADAVWGPEPQGFIPAVSPVQVVHARCARWGLRPRCCCQLRAMACT